MTSVPNKPTSSVPRGGQPSVDTDAPVSAAAQPGQSAPPRTTAATPTASDGFERASDRPTAIEARPVEVPDAAPRASSKLTLLAANKQVDTAPRTGHDLLLADPTRSDVTVLASQGSFVTSAMATGLEKLAEKYPDIDQGYARRFLELSLSAGLLVPKSVYEHELGHARAVKDAGGDAKVAMTGWMSGYTEYRDLPADTPLEKRIAISTAGVNQESANAAYAYKDWARNGSAHYQEAMGYLLGQTNLALYAGRTTLRGDKAPAFDDIKQYSEEMARRGQRITSGQIAAIAAATDLASAPVWAALKGQVDFVTTGERHVELPAFNVGDTKVTFPNFHTYLTSSGPVVGGQLFVNPDKEHPVELSFDTRLDGSAFAAGAKLYDLKVADHVAVNPYLRGTFDRDTGAGVLVGAEVRAKVLGNVDVVGSVEYNHRDLLSEPEGRRNGVNAHVGLSLRF